MRRQKSTTHYTLTASAMRLRVSADTLRRYGDEHPGDVGMEQPMGRGTARMFRREVIDGCKLVRGDGRGRRFKAARKEQR